MLTSTRLSVYDYRGQPIELQLGVRYELQVKNGYILALQAGQKPLKLPNLLPESA